VNGTELELTAISLPKRCEKREALGKFRETNKLST